MGAPVVFGSVLAIPPIEKEELLVLGLAPAGLWGWAAADLSGALDWARVEPSAGPRRSLKRLGLLD